MAVLVLALVTAGWRAAAHRTAAANETIEREIAQLSRTRDIVREDVDRLRQPVSIRARAANFDAAPAQPAKGRAADTKRVAATSKKDSLQPASRNVNNQKTRSAGRANPAAGSRGRVQA
jgi:hypothetical protein